ncbi:cytochrome P450 [Heliocybe sulcata]|uniref:Cytochrome P450 n=1 Tax=Heliocybe sulcata TaxID=5364 RepID=A0A5C3MTP3_9AGAM|nr:cytochrome P450 [Heliocybe sulcata]
MAFAFGSLGPQSVLCAVLLGLSLLAYNLILRKRQPLPPGPNPRLISGNLHQLPREKPWVTFAAWSRLYSKLVIGALEVCDVTSVFEDSPIICFRIYGRKTVVLNTLRSATDLLDARSSIYSARPAATMRNELVGRKMAIFNMSAQHPRFKTYRRLLNSSLNARSTQGYLHIMQDERKILLDNLAADPEPFIAHFRRYVQVHQSQYLRFVFMTTVRNAGGIILKVAYGWTVEGNDDYFVSLMEEAFQLSAEINAPGKWLVDAFPLLRFVPTWFPGARFKREAERYRGRMSEVESVPHKWAKKRIDSGTYIESFTSQHLQPEDGRTVDSQEEDIIKWCSAALYAGGADTTVSALSSFVLLMALHPEVQKRAQAEIDEVLGRDQLPSPGDEASLPYVSAVVQEVLRSSPVAPIGLPHKVTADDEYLGYRIPEGSTVIANIWAIARDEDLYPDPLVFDPTRFLSKNPEERQCDPRKFAFGFGRRICPGEHFAITTLFFNISAILQQFDIRKALDEHGREVDPVVEYTATITSHPKPFKCRIERRASD